MGCCTLEVHLFIYVSFINEHKYLNWKTIDGQRKYKNGDQWIEGEDWRELEKIALARYLNIEDAGEREWGLGAKKQLYL